MFKAIFKSFVASTFYIYIYILHQIFSPVRNCSKYNTWSNKPWLKLGNILGYLARLIFPNQSNPFGQYDKSLRLNLNSRLRAYINCNRGRNMIFYIISTDKYLCIFFSVRWQLLLIYYKFKIVCPVVQSSFVLCFLFASWNKHYVH